MILTKEVEVKPNGKFIKYYRDKGYDAVYRQPLVVRIEDLPMSSTALVDTTCDYCGKLKPPIKYVDYNRQTKNGTEKCCCLDCAKFKREESMIKKYGNKNPMAIPELAKKRQETNLKKYGSNSPSSNPEVRKKQKQTLMKNYGVENPSQSKEIQDKKKQIYIERFGVENPLLSTEIQKKIEQTNLERYGVKNVFLNKNIQNKKNAILIERYGTQYPLQNAECFEKFKQTNSEKYGCEFSIQSEEVREKIKKAFVEKLGVENPFMNDDIKEKIKQTNLEKYGVEYLFSLPSFHEHSREIDMERYGVYHHLQNPDILAKQKDTFYQNGTCPTSKQQKYLYQLYGGELNYSLMMYNLDIYLPKERLDIEFDGSGHSMGIKRGSITEEEFVRKEIIRNNIIKKNGVKQMRIISAKDKLPSDSTLLQMLSEAKQYFSETNHSWRVYDIDKSMLFDAEHKDGISYDFGELRTIKDSDINYIKDSDLTTEETNLNAVHSA